MPASAQTPCCRARGRHQKFDRERGFERARRAIDEERCLEDASVVEERAVADAELEDERTHRRRALTALLELERKQTDLPARTNVSGPIARSRRATISSRS